MEIIQTLITKIGTKPYTTKAGKQIQKTGFQCAEYGDDWLTKFVWEKDDPCLAWRAGDMVEIVVKRNGQYLNFSIPTRLDRLEARVQELEKKLSTPSLGSDEPSLGDEDEMADPGDALNVENLPF